MNLIGEHIDYCGYSVLPMAIDQNVKILVSTNQSKMVKISSTKFDSFECSVGQLKEKIDLDNLKWYHYVFCGFKESEFDSK